MTVHEYHLRKVGSKWEIAAVERLENGVRVELGSQQASNTGGAALAAEITAMIDYDETLATAAP